MDDVSTVEHAKKTISNILELLNINKVVFVDDIFPDVPSIEDIVGAALTIDEKQNLIEIFPELEGKIPEDEEILSAKIKSVWSNLDNKIQLERSKKILNPNQGSDGQPDKTVTILKELMPEIITLSPNQWNEQQAQFIEQNTSEPTLFLFDQDLSNNGGGKEDGIKIIKRIISSTKSPKSLTCGLLTSTVDPDSQDEAWEKLSEENDIPKDLFQVIPKQYIDQEPLYLAYLLKIAILSPEFSDLKKQTSDIMKKATEDAEKMINEINAYDLDQMVFQISKKEGLWEPDMLFRLHSIFHRIRSRVLAGEKRNDLESVSSKLRAVSEISTNISFRPPSKAKQIQRDESFISGEFLNKNFFPIELGDLFEKTVKGSKNRFILLGQPCDLMLRNDGKRNSSYVPLAEITRRETKDNVIPKRSWRELEHYDESPDYIWFVKLETIHFLSLDILDLCSYHSNGAAEFNSKIKHLSFFQPSRVIRYKNMHQKYNSLLEKLNALSNANKENVEYKKIAKELIGGGPFQGVQSGKGQILYKCRRVGRLTPDRSYGLLINYAGMISRPAFDRDLV